MTQSLLAPIVHALLISRRLPLTEYGVQQQQAADNAPKSTAFTAALVAAMSQWSTSTQKALSLHQQQQTLLAQLRALRVASAQAVQAMHLDELAYVNTAEATAGNNPETLQSFGVALRPASGGAHLAAAPAPPATVTVKPGTDPGGLHVKWTRVAKARSYLVELSVEPVTATSWTQLAPQTRTTLKVGDLVPGAAYQVRVAAVTAGGTSAYGTAARGLAR